MLTLAELKRQAAKGNMSLEIIERFRGNIIALRFYFI